MKKQDPKTLTINNVIYAKYIIDSGVLHLNVIKKIFTNNDSASEDFLTEIISAIERKKFSYMAYLNLK